MSFYVTGGSLQSDAPSYVERKADQELLSGLLDGDFCYVLTARQMGKSSLMVRTASKLRSLGIQVAALDLTAIGGQNVSPDQWYHGLLDTLGQELNLEDELEVFWQGNLHLSPLHRLMKALRQIVLGKLGTELHDPPPTTSEPQSTPVPVPTVSRPSVRLVIFVDEIDFVRSLPFAVDEFFAAIRQCYNQRSLDAGYRRLTFCLLGVASPSDLIRDTRTTPFNIGRRIELNDFTPEEAAPLAEGLQLAGSAPAAAQAVDLLARILFWTEGHPYLSQKLCRVTAEALQAKERAGESGPVRGAEFVDRVCSDLFLSHRARERDDNLVFVREQLLRHETHRADLLDFYLKVRAGRRVVDDELDPLVRILRLSGVVRVSDGRLRERNRIYGRVFDAEWARANMPEAELRRQRQAYRRGVAWATSVSAIILAIMGWLVVTRIAETRRQQFASAQAYFSQAQSKRASGRAGQRLQSLHALDQARAHYTNSIELRNEAIACLALVDLARVTNSFQVPPGTAEMTANRTLTHCALVDARGAVQLLEVVAKESNPIALTPSAAGGKSPELPSGPVQWLTLSPNAEYVAAQCGEGATARLTIWNYRQGKAAIQLASQIPQRAVDFSRDGTKVALGLAEGTVAVYALPGGERLCSLSWRTATDDPRKPTCVCFDPAGKQIAEASSNSSHVLIYELGAKEPLMILQGHRSPGAVLAWHPDGQHLAVASEHRDIYLWDLRVRKQEEITQAHTGAIYDMAFNHRGDLLATVGGEMALKLWIPATRRQVIGECEADPKGRLQFAADDTSLAHISAKGGVQQWWIQKPDSYHVFRTAIGENGGWTGLCFNADGRLLLTGSETGLNFVDASSGVEIASLPVKGCQAGFLDPAGGDLFASTSYGFYCWPKQNAKALGGSVIAFGPPTCLNLPSGLGTTAFASAGGVASALHGDHVHVAELAHPFSSDSFPFPGKYKSVELNSCGNWLATWSEENNKLGLWQVTKKPTETKLRKELSSTQQYRFSPEGRWVLTSWNKQLQLWELGTWRSYPLQIGASHPGYQNGAIALAEVGESTRRLLAMVVQPNIIKIFEFNVGAAPSCHECATLESPDRQDIVSLCFSPDGTRLAARTADQTVELWDLARLQANLVQRKLPGPFPLFPIRIEQPLGVTIDRTPVDTELPRHWRDVEASTALLADPATHSPAETAKPFASRGRALFKLGQFWKATADLTEALRLNPADPAVEELLRRAASSANQTTLNP